MSLRNESGMSLVQVLIAAGLMGLLAVFMMRMQENQIKGQNTVATKAEVTEFVQKLNSYLSTPGYCEKNLGSKDLSPDSEFSLNKILTPNDVVLYEVGKKYGNRHFILESIQKEKFFYDTDEKNSGILKLVVELKKTKKSYGNSTIKKVIELIVQLDSEGHVSGCGAASTVGVGGQTGIDIETVSKVVTGKDNGETKVESVQIDKVKKVIEGNPALQELQKSIKNLKDSNKRMEEMQKTFN